MKLFKLFVLLAFVAISSSANSSSFTGKIKRVLSGPAYGNTIIVDVVGTPSNRNTCHSNANYDFAFDGSTEKGKMYLSMVLAAYTAKLNVNMAGATTCVFYGGIEDLHHVMLDVN